MMNNLPETFSAYVVRQSPAGAVSGCVELLSHRDLPPGDVAIRVLRTSVNYKDALAAAGHPGIVRQFPHVPGIDSAGLVLASQTPRFSPGQHVLSVGHELGVERFGGWSEYVRVPSDWVLPVPEGLTVETAMALGTAGFTAAQCVQALESHGVSPQAGEVIVTGATGGVGSLAVRLLSRQGYAVVAVTGKPAQRDWLQSIGAARVVAREELLVRPDRHLLKAAFAGAIDTVGGTVLAGLLRFIGQRGCVACCGVAAGPELRTTVYPFILRGLTLAGIDSAWCPDELRPAIWQRLARTLSVGEILDGTRSVPLQGVTEITQEMLAGRTTGRTVVEVQESK